MRVGRSVAAAVSTHEILTTGVHGVGSKYVAETSESDGTIDVDAIAAMGAKAAANPLRHDIYLDSQAVTAMGSKANNNPLNHDRFLAADAAGAVTFENLNTNGDIGAGAAQVPAGDHTHTLSDDVEGSEKDDSTGGDSGTYYRLTNAVARPGTVTLASKTLTFAALSRAVIVGFTCIKLPYTTTKFELVVAGVVRASQAGVFEGNIVHTHIEALSGEQTCQVRLNDTGSNGTADCLRYTRTSTTEYPAGIGIGSITI